MTIRNAVPRFGKRTVVVLAVLAMVALETGPESPGWVGGFGQ